MSSEPNEQPSESLGVCKVTLGTWQTQGGNNCTANLLFIGADAIRIEFGWQRPWDPDDRDYHYGVILKETLGYALEEAEKWSGIIAALYQAEAEGYIRKVRVKDRQWVWQRTGRLEDETPGQQ